MAHVEPTDLVPAAIIDIGTNTMNMLARTEDGTTERFVRMPRLGKDVERTKRLSEEAMQRCYAVADEYRELLERMGVERRVVVATSASRDGTNRDEFFEGITARLGASPRLIDGAEEAMLSFVGATSDLDAAAGPFLMVDIGGGSTEFAVGGAEVDQSISVDIGAVRLTETFFGTDPIRPDDLAGCLAVVGVHLDDVLRTCPAIADAKTFVGVAGTVTTAAAVEIGLAEYDFDTLHGFELSKVAAEDVFRTLATETIAQRLDNPGMYPGREGVIVGGLCVLISVMRRYGFDTCRVSERNLLDGAMAVYIDRQTGVV